MTPKESQAWIQSWIRSEVAKLDTTGLRSPRLGFDGEMIVLSGWGKRPGDEKETYLSFVAYSIEEAHQEMREAIPTKDTLANRLRDKAKDLLKQAKELEAQNA